MHNAFIPVLGGVLVLLCWIAGKTLANLINR